MTQYLSAVCLFLYCRDKDPEQLLATTRYLGHKVNKQTNKQPTEARPGIFDDKGG